MSDPLANLIRQMDRKKYGKFRATVVDNQDPEKKGRLKLQIPSILGTQQSDWALPCVPFGGGADHGFFMIPNVESQVWVEFEEGDIDRPIWTGTFWQQDMDIPQEGDVDEMTTRLIKTPSGHILQFDDKEGEEKIKLHHKTQAELTIDENGTLKLIDAGGALVTLDADGGQIVIEDTNGNTISLTSSGTTLEDGNGNKVEMASSGITIQAQQIVLDGSMVALGGSGGEPVIKGQSFLTLFATHMHPSAMGPTGPPVPQGEMSTLSMKVTTS